MKTRACTAAFVAMALAACSGSPSGAETPAQAGTDAMPDDTTAGRAPAPAATGQGDQDAVAGNASDVDAGTAPAATQADYLGRWTGVEGMYLVVADKPGGGVTLEMQWDLDHKGTFDGSVTAEGLRFMRDGVAESAVHTDGDATGLKYLAGKQDCLTVKPGEGYCRD